MSALHPAQARACALLEYHGIDPHEVMVRDITTETYERRAYDSRGNGLFDVINDVPASVTTPWPKGFPVDQLLAELHQWQGAFK